MGTSPFPFERLVRAAEDLAAAGHDVVVQHGASRPPAGCRTVRHLDPDAFREAMAGARVVVLHGGLACRAEARASGRVPLVVPRRGTLGEHVDDHQVHAARADAAFVVEPGQLVAAVAAWSEPLVRPAREEETTERFRAWLDQVCPST
jgi:UDP-N-acetylglucosamine transferase subunit ALG13